ncbi:MAG: hypothetical protein RRY23_00045 [Alistipes sp.]
MKKIMFNDRFGLTEAVIEKRKTVTRRMAKEIKIFNPQPPYYVGEVVAVAQSYATIAKNHQDVDYFLEQVGKSLGIDDFDGAGWFGWKNKMVVKADLMPHQIRILSVRAERLRDITDEDCLAEGILLKENRVWCNHEEHFITDYRFPNSKYVYATAKEAFATLINKISGKGTWNANPWVWRIEFELIK